MKNLPILYIVFSIGLFLFISSCECDDPTDPDCDNYDPCYESEPVKASFTIKEVVPPYGGFVYEAYEPYDTDTIRIRTVVFEAPEGMDEYTWLIGSEVLHDRVVERGGFPRGETIPITLIVRKTPQFMCFPDDDGIDTLVRYMYVMVNSCNSLIHGRFHGALTHNPQDTFTMEYHGCPPYTVGDTLFPYPRFENLFRNCGIVRTPSGLKGYKHATFWAGDNGTFCDIPYGTIYISGTANEKVTINYTFSRGSQKDQWFTFEGIRQD